MTDETNSYIASLLRKRAHTDEPGKRSEIDAQLRANGVDPDAKDEPKTAELVPERHTAPRETMAAPTVRRGRKNRS